MSGRLLCWLLAAALAAADASSARGQSALEAGEAPAEAALAGRIFAPRHGPSPPGSAAPAGRSASPSAAASVPRPLPLAPPRQRADQNASRPSAPSATRAATSMIGALTVVLGLFFLVVWFLRRTQRIAHAPLPSEAVQLLGRAPLSGRQQMHLVRFGEKLLLLAVTPTAAETLSEITDAEQVDRLVSLCRRNQPDSIAQSFRQVLHQIGREPAPRGFVGPVAPGAVKTAGASRAGKP